MVYRAQEGFVNFGLCETNSNRSEVFRMRNPSLNGKGDEENRFDKVAASPNLQKLTERGIDALIIGAGPTGLTLGCELIRRGLKVRLVEKLPQATDQSRALALQSRTLEIFERMGILD